MREHAEHAHAGRPELGPQRAAGDAGARAVHGLERHVLPARRGDEHVHRQPRPAALHPLRGADAPSWLGSTARQPLSDRRQGQRLVRASRRLETDPNTYERLGNAFAVILTNKGAPLIYYGDEIGLPGAGDPDNRRMMLWSGYSPAQQALLRAHQGAHGASARRTRRCGAARARRSTSTQDLWVYEMTTLAGDPTPDTVYVAINRSDNDRTTTALPGGLTELLTNTPAAGAVTIPARADAHLQVARRRGQSSSHAASQSSSTPVASSSTFASEPFAGPFVGALFVRIP